MKKLVLALLLMVAPPAMAQTAEPVPAAVEEGLALMNSGAPEAALARLDTALAAAALPRERGAIQRWRGLILADMGQLAEARAAMEVAVASDPAPAPPLLAVLFKLRALDDDAPAAAETLVLLAASDRRELDALPTALVGRVRAGLAANEARAFDLDFALVTAGWTGDGGDDDTLDALRMTVIGGLLARDRVDEAAALLDDVLSPNTLLRLGIDRRFSALWPEVEARLGPGARAASEADVARAKARFEAAPEAVSARRLYAEALNLAAREDEALEVASGAALDAAGLDALAVEDLWLVALEAQLLAHFGRGDEALARYDALATSQFDGRPDLIGPIIARALFAVALDRPAAALSAADFAAERAEIASPSGRLFIDAARACALSARGEQEAADAAAAALLGVLADNRRAGLMALICLDRLDEAAALIVAALDDPQQRTDMLWELQPFLIAAHEGSIDARARTAMRALKARRDVRAAFEAAGRDLPKAVSPPR
jgi:hypothetical protein